MHRLDDLLYGLPASFFHLAELLVLVLVCGVLDGYYYPGVLGKVFWVAQDVRCDSLVGVERVDRAALA